MIEKHKSRPRTDRRAFGFRNTRVFRRRRNTLLALCTLLIVGLAALGASWLNTALFSAESSATVARVEPPALAEAPEAVAEAQPATGDERAEGGEAGARATTRNGVEEEAGVAPPPPSDPTLYLTVPRLGIYGHTVRNDDSQWALDMGAIKLPPTGFPWQRGANTYIAGHRIGWPGTESYYQFYNLPAMQPGDAVYLTDTNGTVYTYRVSEIFAISPSDVWVTNPIVGRDMVSLQTCTETPNDWWTIGPRLFESGPNSGRLIVRADKVAMDYI